MASRALAIEPIEPAKTKEPEEAAAMKQVDRIAEAQSEPEITAPTHEEVARLAHSYWLARRPDDGCAEDDWHRAERELRNRAH